MQSLNAISLILIFLACTLLLLAYHIYFTKVGLSTNLVVQTPHKKLSHNKLLTLFACYGFQLSDGVCFGVSLLWAVLFMTNNEETFYKQLDALRRYQDCLPEKLRDIPMHSTSEEDALLLNFKYRIKKIIQIQSPEEYPNIYRKHTWQADIDVILATINDPHHHVKRQFMHTHAFKDRNDAKYIFSQLFTSLHQHKFVLLLSSHAHTIAITIQGNQWLVLNTNSLYEHDLKYPYLRFNTDGMVDYLYTHFAAKLSRHLILSMDFIGKPHTPIDPNLRWLKAIAPLSATYQEGDNNTRLSFLSIAAFQGDMSAIRQGIKRGWGAFFHYHSSDSSPITLAISQGRTEVFIALLNAAPHNLNIKRQCDKKSLLHLAVLSHTIDIVRYLLNLKKININSTDINGETPLMISCTTLQSKTDDTIIRLLLAKGASINIKSTSGKTVYDYAKDHSNPIATKYLTEYNNASFSCSF